MKCAKEDLLLYAVTDRYWLNGRTLYEVVKESLDGGVTWRCDISSAEREDTG